MQVVTLVIAAWGALLSTLIAIRQIWLDRPRLMLSAWPEIHKISDNPISHLHSIVVSVDNRGRRPIWITEVGWSHGQEVMRWEDAPTAHFDARNRVDLPQLIDAGTRLNIPVWAIADSWPGDHRTDLKVGVRGGGREWLTRVDQQVKVTG